MAQGDAWNFADERTVSSNTTETVDVRPAGGKQLKITTQVMCGDYWNSPQKAYLEPKDFESGTAYNRAHYQSTDDSTNRTEYEIFADNDFGVRFRYTNDSGESLKYAGVLTGVELK